MTVFVRRFPVACPFLRGAAIALFIAVSLCGFGDQSVGAVSSTIVISQVYGGGGNSGAPLQYDFIELLNVGTSAVNVSTWSVQYASTQGTSWQRTNLSGTIQPGQYYLVQEGSNANVGATPPTPDATGTIMMSASAGKVALLSNQTTIVGGVSCPAGAVDLVGFATGTNCFEGAGPTASLTNTTAALRKTLGCTDTDDNSADFATGPPNPRNTSSPLASCGESTNPSGSGAANPASVV